MNDGSIHISVQPVWGTVRNMRYKIRKLLEEFGVEIIYASEIVASELLENAIKYGTAVPELSSVEFHFEYSPKEIIISVRNGVIEESENFKIFKLYIDNLIRSEEPQTLYINRLKEIIENPEDEGSRLGLYRIPFETDYLLSYRVENNVLEVTAICKIQD
ncbi:MAG: hypothetical protein H7A25_21110 [Leptospiraceae bacterium]|nr:hypothetical protein [Leptospiraceae bacterium]MCP5502410.1 hypothetical protein [Leptospiraceae bacterium]